MNLKDAENQSIIAWINSNQIKTENGKPFDLNEHPYLWDILKDWSPFQVVLAAAQCGKTTTFLLKMLWAVKNFGINAVYTMPTVTDAHDLVSGKLDPIVNENPVLQSWISGDKDSVEQKRIGQNTVYLRGTWTERAALSFSSDLNIHDEEDRSNQPVIDQYVSRLQHSKKKWQWRFSNPSFEGNGVHRFWQESDQKHWFVTCGFCKKQQFLQWPNNVDQQQKRFICAACGQEISDNDRRHGEWHARKFEVKPKYSGYWISQLMVPSVSAAEIIEAHRTMTAENFSNFVLGQPFVGSGSKMTEDKLFQNLKDYEQHTEEDPVVIGVDTGLPIWYVCGNKDGVFHWGSCESYDELERLLKRWPKSILVSDQGGDLIGIRELQERYNGRVFLTYYRRDRKTQQLIQWGEGSEYGKVVVDRNRTIQMLIDEFSAKRIPIYVTREDWQQVWLHFANIYRTEEEDKLGVKQYVWQRNGPDHLVHALVYFRVGMDKFGFKDGGNFVDPNAFDWNSIPQAPITSYDGKTSWVGINNRRPERDRDWRDI